MKRRNTHVDFFQKISGRGISRSLAFIGAGLFLIALVAYAADSVPTDIKFPGTQPTPTDNPPTLGSFGIGAMALLILGAGTVVLRKRKAVVA